MSNERIYYVICADGCKFESMTKEQILTAIEQAIRTGEIKDVDTGFVTKIKEQNAGKYISFWVGTQAQYNALTEKPENCMCIFTDEKTVEEKIRDQIQIFEDEKYTGCYFRLVENENEWLNPPCVNGKWYLTNERFYGKKVNICAYEGIIKTESGTILDFNLLKSPNVIEISGVMTKNGVRVPIDQTITVGVIPQFTGSNGDELIYKIAINNTGDDATDVCMKIKFV